MDANKLVALRALPYRINPCCGLCKFGSFPSDDWGSCEATKYDHLKHSEATRDISIHKYGTCKNFEPAPERLGRLDRFLEFFDEKFLDEETLWKLAAEAWQKVSEQAEKTEAALDEFLTVLKERH